MSWIIRVLLVVGAVILLWMVIRRIRKRKILMQDSIYWIVLSFVLLLLAIFPGIIIWVAYTLKFMSPSNFVFLVVIALLILKVFSNSSEISMLRHKVEELSQESVLRTRARKPVATKTTLQAEQPQQTVQFQQIEQPQQQAEQDQQAERPQNAEQLQSAEQTQQKEPPQEETAQK